MMQKPSAAEARKLAAATNRIHAILCQIEFDRATTFGLSEGCYLSMATALTSPLYRVIVIHNRFLHDPIRPHYHAASEVRKELRRECTRAARPFEVSFEK